MDDCISLDTMREAELNQLNPYDDPNAGLHEFTSTDRFMELNDELPRDSEEFTQRSKQENEMLWGRPIPRCDTFGERL